jgi:flagellar protein FliO/FliZ
LGGEKLSVRNSVFAAVLFITAGFTVIVSPPAAEGQEQSGEITSQNPAEAQEAQFPAEIPAQLPAEESFVLGENAAGAPLEGTASVWIVFRMVLVLALAALAIYGVVFFIKRLARPSEARDPHLKVLASTPLGNGTFAAVVSVGSKAWLVGGGDAGVSLIAEIDEQEALEAMLVDEARKTAESRPGRFPSFRSLLEKLGGSPARSGQGNTHVEALRKQRERLKGL